MEYSCTKFIQIKLPNIIFKIFMEKVKNFLLLTIVVRTHFDNQRMPTLIYQSGRRFRDCFWRKKVKLRMH
jgi:hypothetical protein